MEQEQFKDFMESNESGRFVINPYWCEYLLNLFHQGYYGEIAEELIHTKIDHNNQIEKLAFKITMDSMK